MCGDGAGLWCRCRVFAECEGERYLRLENGRQLVCGWRRRVGGVADRERQRVRDQRDVRDGMAGDTSRCGRVGECHFPAKAQKWEPERHPHEN